VDEQGGETGRDRSEFAAMNADRVVVVTGGTGGLGRVVVRALLDDGWTVHVPSRERAHADQLAGAADAPQERLHVVEADIALPAEVERLFADVDRRSIRLDALLNLAGGFAMGRIDESGPELWDEMIATNATSAYLCCRAAVPRLKRAGGGRIVNVAAAAALAPRPGISAYVASKAAVVALTRALAAELAPDRITVNAVAPTTIDTAATRASMPKADRSGWVAPEAIADTIRWLLDERSASVTGTVIEMGR
jgi:NAD(P)-dependent dehydrogenase (short-subunit alcohol dehydrogenase family)